MQRKTWGGWIKEKNAAIKKVFACHFAQRKQPMHHDVLLAIKHFPILEERGVPKVENKVRNEILKMDACEHWHVLGIETSSLLSLRHFATGTGTNIYLLEFIKYEKALCIVSADHEKTFDTADHQILSQKLYHRGI